MRLQVNVRYLMHELWVEYMVTCHEQKFFGQKTSAEERYRRGDAWVSKCSPDAVVSID